MWTKFVIFVIFALSSRVDSFPQSAKQLAIAIKQTELAYYNRDVSCEFSDYWSEF